ncbi:homeobox-leucine zipper protein ROC9-like [Panicum virgatum]|uniref:homeobox-leucine zipper protein ROC9-like n=1 Tax=Panicum virgatum TaxID=38727 RepID=UPI0019D512EE|nr:homeobox-leucine zipper protein ROC9-like [Panicum virgatum]
MASSLCRVLGGSRDLAWSGQASNRGGVRVTSRRNAGDDPGEPQGLIACGVLSAWLPVSPAALFDFLRDESRRHEWDVMLLPGRPVRSCLRVAKGNDRGNCVTAYVGVRSFVPGGTGPANHVMSVLLRLTAAPPDVRPRHHPRESRTASGSSRTAAPTPARRPWRTRRSAPRPCGR